MSKYNLPAWVSTGVLLLKTMKMVVKCHRVQKSPTETETFVVSIPTERLRFVPLVLSSRHNYYQGYMARTSPALRPTHRVSSVHVARANDVHVLCIVCMASLGATPDTADGGSKDLLY